jgi:hypothetical protein
MTKRRAHAGEAPIRGNAMPPIGCRQGTEVAWWLSSGRDFLSRASTSDRRPLESSHFDSRVFSPPPRHGATETDGQQSSDCLFVTRCIAVFFGSYVGLASVFGL